MSGDLVTMVGGRRYYRPLSDFLLKEEVPGADYEQIVKQDDLDMSKKAMSGDLVFKCDPAEADAEIDDQNVGVAQVIAYDIAGAVGGTGTGDLTITVTSAALEEAWTDDVTLANSDNATAIATKIEAALEATGGPCHSSTGVMTVARSTARLTLTMNNEAANDATLALEIGDFSGTADPAITATEHEDSAVAGVAPYTRDVVVTLEDAEGNLHDWFTGTVPVTVAETTNGDGVASIATVNPTMTSGTMTIAVTLQKTWAAGVPDTNTLSVSEKTILGYTVAAKTSVETSIDTP